MSEQVWPIELGVAVGPFRLGDSIAEVLHALKSRMPIRPLEIIYDTTDPYSKPVLIKSDEDGLKLHFDPVRQILVKIEFYDVNRVPLKYGRVIIFGGDVPATFMSIYNLFGPTFPGHFDAAQKSYSLSYKGGSFRFPIPTEYAHLYEDKTDLPLEFPNGMTPAVSNFMVFVGDDYQSPLLPQPTRRHYFEEVAVEIGECTTSFEFKGREQHIELGWSPQEVTSEIGAPVSVFRKSEDSDHGLSGGYVGDYFHNYPHLGLDIMYDSLHTVSKVILKTNALGHPDFGVYHKCNFRICFLADSFLDKAHITKSTTPEITPETQWQEIQKIFKGASDLRPVVHDNGLGLHPFGSTLCYSPIPGCTVEVMKSGFIASVTLSKI